MLVSLSRLAGICGLVVGAVASAGCGKGPPQLAEPEAPGVNVVRPAMRNYAPYKEFTGRLATKDPVKVVPQVTGILLKREFADGAVVVKDKTVLYRIDPVLFQADVEKANADIAKADADILKAKADSELATVQLRRAQEEVDKGAGSPSNRDEKKANLDVSKAMQDVAKANRKAAESGLAKAQQNLKYCTIYAPTTGRLDQSRVAEQSVVTAYQTVMCDVFPLDPIYCMWDVDELTSLWYRDRITAGVIADPRNPATPLRCWITTKDGKTYPPADKPGQPVDFVAPEIVRGTGTRTIRALFPNPVIQTKRPDGKESDIRPLSGGDSVTVRLEAGRETPVLMVREVAVMSTSREKFVYLANEKNEVEMRPVELGASQDGWQVVLKGLATSDRVITTNLLRVRPGVPVKVQEEQ